MKFTVFCDDEAVYKERKQPNGAGDALSIYKGYTRKQLQSLAKKNGIKANLKSNDIIRKLNSIEKQKTFKRDKHALQDIENIDPRTLNKKSDKLKILGTASNKRRAKVVKLAESPLKQAKAALEIEKVKRITKLAAKEAAARANQMSMISPNHTRSESSIVPDKNRNAFEGDEHLHDKFKTEIYETIVLKKEVAKRIRENMEHVETLLQEQKELKENFHKAKKLRLMEENKELNIPDMMNNNQTITTLSQNMLGALSSSEKENISPGCKYPVEKSSIYFSAAKKLKRP